MRDDRIPTQVPARSRNSITKPVMHIRRNTLERFGISTTVAEFQFANTRIRINWKILAGISKLTKPGFVDVESLMAYIASGNYLPVGLSLTER